MLEKIVERTKTLKIEDPVEADVNIGPVIDEKAYEKITAYIETGKDEGRLIIGGERAVILFTLPYFLMLTGIQG